MTSKPMTSWRCSLVVALLGLVPWVSSSCSPPPEDETISLQMSPAVTFEPVSEALHSHCGSLDCHGQVGRNLRLYGANGLRLDPREFPGGSVSTQAEFRENYQSVIALEPELIARVFAESGANPERLTLVRKGRGTEHHKGGEAMVPGGAADRCLLSWLASNVDLDACAEAAEVVPPGDAGLRR
jgi:hypothetical protein